MATTAREVRAAVRAELAKQVHARQEAALTVAAAWGKVEKARERLAAAEREAGTAADTAAQKLTVADLAKLAGVPAAELRRLIRASRAEQSSSSANRRQPAAAPSITDATAQPEPAPATS